MTRILIKIIKSLKGMFTTVRFLAAAGRLKRYFEHRTRDESKTKMWL